MIKLLRPFRTSNQQLSDVTGFSPSEIRKRQRYFNRRFVRPQKRVNANRHKIDFDARQTPQSKKAARFGVVMGYGLIPVAASLLIAQPAGLVGPGLYVWAPTTIALGSFLGTKALLNTGFLYRRRESTYVELVEKNLAKQDLRGTLIGPGIYLQDGMLALASTIVKQEKHRWFSDTFTRRSIKISQAVDELFKLGGNDLRKASDPEFRAQLLTALEWSDSFNVALRDRIAPRTAAYARISHPSLEDVGDNPGTYVAAIANIPERGPLVSRVETKLCITRENLDIIVAEVKKKIGELKKEIDTIPIDEPTGFHLTAHEIDALRLEQEMGIKPSSTANGIENLPTLRHFQRDSPKHLFKSKLPEQFPPLAI